MKVLLVYPTPPPTHWPQGLFRSRWVPQGIASIAACLLRGGHQVRVLIREEQLVEANLDWARANNDLRRLLEEFRPDLLGLSVVTPAIGEAAAIAGVARQILGRSVMVVAGGPHPSALPEETLECFADLDAVAVGEGEATLLELADHGRLDASVNGLVFRDGGGGLVRTPPRKIIADLDSLPDMPYDLFNMEFHTAPGRSLIRWLKMPAISLRTSRGCTNRCSFCAGSVIAGLGVRFHSVGRVLDEMAYVADRFEVRGVRFEDETIGASPERLMELCQGIQSRSLHRRLVWDCCLRVDQGDLRLLKEMKAAGCIQVEYGFESGSDSCLKALGKRADVDENRRAVRLTRQAGLRIFADIMIGLPGERIEDLEQTKRFLRWARPEVIVFAALAPLPGTPIFQNLPAEVRRHMDWARYTYFDAPRPWFNVTAMSDEVFEREYRRMLKYFIQPQMMRALLRDGTRGDPSLARAIRRKLLSFILRHPLRAARVPW